MRMLQTTIAVAEIMTQPFMRLSWVCNRRKRWFHISFDISSESTSVFHALVEDNCLSLLLDAHSGWVGSEAKIAGARNPPHSFWSKKLDNYYSTPEPTLFDDELDGGPGYVRSDESWLQDIDDVVSGGKPRTSHVTRHTMLYAGHVPMTHDP
jgi:hypothetical protein